MIKIGYFFIIVNRILLNLTYESFKILTDCTNETIRFHFTIPEFFYIKDQTSISTNIILQNKKF